jgi:arylsulfatase A-like enzyme
MMLAAAGTTTGAGFSSSAPRPSNVILLLTDDQGYGDLSCHGHPHLRTPHMDGLHSESLRFTDFHVDPTCAPTRSALMTGRCSHRVGVWHTIMGRNALRPGEVTMAEVFRASGYRTGIFGKWHLGANYPLRPIDRGFDQWVGHGDGGTGTTTDYWGNCKMNDSYLRNGRWERFSGFGTDIFFDEAMRFIERGGDTRPFFVYLATNDPHEPCNVPGALLERHLAAGIPRPLAHFYASIERVDANLGRLRALLARNGLDRNTILLFMTDNGSARRASFDPGLRGVKGSQYDGGHRVPFFLRLPGARAVPRDVPQLAAHVDVLPTLIDLCGLKRPGGVHFDGASLAPLARGSRSWPGRALLVESQRIAYPARWRQCAMMTERWRLVDGRELYDLSSDRAQRTDVAAAYPDVVARLRERYEALWPEISARDRQFCRSIAGHSAQPEICLTSQDWIPDEGSRNLVFQYNVAAGQVGNGFWPIQIARPGAYRFTLRRWPRETGAAITAPLSVPLPGDVSIEDPQNWREGAALPIARARLAAGPLFDATKPVAAGDAEIVFDVPLPAGPVDVRSWFDGPGLAPRGAYYLYVRRS